MGSSPKKLLIIFSYHKILLQQERFLCYFKKRERTRSPCGGYFHLIDAFTFTVWNSFLNGLLREGMKCTFQIQPLLGCIYCPAHQRFSSERWCENVSLDLGMQLPVREDNIDVRGPVLWFGMIQLYIFSSQAKYHLAHPNQNFPHKKTVIISWMNGGTSFREPCLLCC